MLRISLQASGINNFLTNEGFLASYKKKEVSLDYHFDLYLHDIAEILLKMALNTNQSINP
jgi:hypothetical protein